MVKLTKQQEIEGLTNFLKNFDKNENYFITPTADGRLGKKYAIAEKLEYGAINTKTNFMTYAEMNCFFMGMITMKENRIKF